MRLLLSVVIVLVGAGLAVAQDGTNAVPDGDDSPSQVDIASVRATHDRANDRLAHIVRFHAGIAPNDFRNSAGYLNASSPPRAA